MPDYKLTYFDIDGGRAESIRIALHAAGIEFEDNRLSFREFGELRHTMRFNSVPVLEIDGAAVTQSNALSRYVGKIAGLYPAHPVQALYCDEVLGALEDLNHYVVRTFGLEGEELRMARESLVDGWLSVFLQGLNELLIRGGGSYFADDARYRDACPWGRQKSPLSRGHFHFQHAGESQTPAAMDSKRQRGEYMDVRDNSPGEQVVLVKRRQFPLATPT